MKAWVLALQYRLCAAAVVLAVALPTHAFADVSENKSCALAVLDGLKSLNEAGIECGYRAGYCSDHVLMLFNDLKKSGVSESKIKVLYVYGESLGDGLHPLNPRLPVPGWRFHAILEVNGMIVDPDYGQKPVMIRPETYFRTMFGSQNVSFDKIRVKEMDPNQYSKVFEEKGPAHYIYQLNESEESHPTKSVNEYLKSKNPSYVSRQSQVIESKEPSPWDNTYRLISANRPRFEGVGRGNQVRFDYVGDGGKQTEVTGTIVSVTPKSIKIRTAEQISEIPYELIFPASITALLP